MKPIVIIVSVCAALVIAGVICLVRALFSAQFLNNEGDEDERDWQQRHHAVD